MHHGGPLDLSPRRWFTALVDGEVRSRDKTGLGPCPVRGIPRRPGADDELGKRGGRLLFMGLWPFAVGRLLVVRCGNYRVRPCESPAS